MQRLAPRQNDRDNHADSERRYEVVLHLRAEQERGDHGDFGRQSRIAAMAHPVAYERADSDEGAAHDQKSGRLGLRREPAQQTDQRECTKSGRSAAQAAAFAPFPLDPDQSANGKRRQQPPERRGEYRL